MVLTRCTLHLEPSIIWPSDNCEGSGHWNLLAWEDGAGDPLCPYIPYSTVAGNQYGGHDPCECGDNLVEGDAWDMQGCVSYPQ